MSVQKFTKKQVEVEAIQWNKYSNKQEVEQFVGRELKSELESETAYLAGVAPIFSLLIETKEGTMKAFKGDWIIKEPFPTGDRDFYPCKPDIFQKTYEKSGSVYTGMTDKNGVKIYRNQTCKITFEDSSSSYYIGEVLMHESGLWYVGEPRFGLYKFLNLVEVVEKK